MPPTHRESFLKSKKKPLNESYSIPEIATRIKNRQISTAFFSFPLAFHLIYTEKIRGGTHLPAILTPILHQSYFISATLTEDSSASSGQRSYGADAPTLLAARWLRPCRHMAARCWGVSTMSLTNLAHSHPECTPFIQTSNAFSGASLVFVFTIRRAFYLQSPSPPYYRCRIDG